MKVLQWLDWNFEEIQGIVLTILMVIIMGVQVNARYVFNNSLSWSEEFARYIFIWLAFISIGYCVNRNSSIKVMIVIQLLPQKLQTAFAYLEDIIVIAFYLFMTKAAWDYLMVSVTSGQVSPAMHIPMWIIQSAPLVGFVLVVIRRLEAIVRRSTGKEVQKEEAL